MSEIRVWIADLKDIRPEGTGMSMIATNQPVVSKIDHDAALQAIRDERDRLIKEYVRLFRLCEPIAKMLSELSILPIGCSREQELAWKMAVKNFRHYQRDYAADVLLQTALTPAGQRWTRSKPTEPGWYWFRSLLGDVEIVSIGRVNGVRMVYGHGYGTGVKMEYLGSGEWQGPISPNEATE